MVQEGRTGLPAAGGTAGAAGAQGGRRRGRMAGGSARYAQCFATCCSRMRIKARRRSRRRGHQTDQPPSLRTVPHITALHSRSCPLALLPPLQSFRVNVATPPPCCGMPTRECTVQELCLPFATACASLPILAALRSLTSLDVYPTHGELSAADLAALEAALQPRVRVVGRPN